MSHVAIITGISGVERFLKGRSETPEAKEAQRFRSEETARRAAQAHIEAFPPVVRRQMKFIVKPIERRA